MRAGKSRGGTPYLHAMQPPENAPFPSLPHLLARTHADMRRVRALESGMISSSNYVNTLPQRGGDIMCMMDCLWDY